MKGRLIKGVIYMIVPCIYLTLWIRRIFRVGIYSNNIVLMTVFSIQVFKVVKITHLVLVVDHCQGCAALHLHVFMGKHHYCTCNHHFLYHFVLFAINFCVITSRFINIFPYYSMVEKFISGKII